MSQGFLSRLEWRNATKSFDTSKPATDEQIRQVLEAIRMAPTSYGIQPFSVKVVTSSEVKKKLSEAGWGQDQFTSATALLIFVADTHVAERLEQQIKLRSASNAAAREQLKPFQSMVLGTVSKFTPEAAKTWTQKQAYIGLGFGLAAAAEVGIDSCPMEGFSPEAVDKILGLPAGHFSTVILALGTRKPGVASHPKWRFPSEHFFQFID